MPANFWKATPTFITGATGLLRSWLLQRLVEEGANVVALVRDGAPQSMAVGSGLLTQVETVPRYTPTEGLDETIHRYRDYFDKRVTSPRFAAGVN